MKQTFTLFFLSLALLVGAQTTVDFESFTIEPDSFLNGSDGSGGFTTSAIFLPNTFSVFPNFTAWSGWSLSNKTDVTTPGFGNQYSAITGGGFEGSSNYAVGFVSGSGNMMHLRGMAAGEIVNGFWITNGTYPYLSMKEGDTFAKKFGGTTGDDPDFLYVSVKTYLNGNLSADSVNFYLADYRFDDNSMDYIIDTWEYVDLTILGAADSLAFSMYSSDVGMNGINTPLYICMDNFITSADVTPVIDIDAEKAYEVYPNPANDFVILKNNQTQGATVTIYDMLGRAIDRQTLLSSSEVLDVSTLARGSYLLELRYGQNIESHLLIKN